jgi:hypothetical protein
MHGQRSPAGRRGGYQTAGCPWARKKPAKSAPAPIRPRPQLPSEDEWIEALRPTLLNRGWTPPADDGAVLGHLVDRLVPVIGQRLGDELRAAVRAYAGTDAVAATP